MPNVLTTPTGQSDGSTVTEFLDVTSTTAVTYTYPASQNKLVIHNQGSENILVTVGSQTNVAVTPNETKEFIATFTTFSIRSTVNSQAFKATAIVVVPALDASLFETKANATATYATKAQITPLAVKTEVASTYQTIALAETKANAAATYGKVKTVNGVAPDAAGNVTLA